MGIAGIAAHMVYFRIQRVHRCDRCEMQYAWELTQCPHCSGVNEEELVLFKLRRDQELNEIAGLGRVFIVLAIALLVFMILTVAN